MKSFEEMETLEKTIGQLKSIYDEVTLLSKKSQNDGVNKFKLGMINNVLRTANLVLGDKYKPMEGFLEFDDDDVPSNSDVAFVLSQYLVEIERFRTDNVTYSDYKWVYLIDKKPSSILADAKTRRKG